jgi:hypothetical protein
MLLLANLQREELNPWARPKETLTAPGARKSIGSPFLAIRSSNPRSPPPLNMQRPLMSFFGELKEWDRRMFQDQRAYVRVAMRPQVTSIVDSETSRAESCLGTTMLSPTT